MSHPLGQLAIVLHAHLPFVRHPDARDPFLEETWFFEAISECYLPLLRLLEGWRRDLVPARLAMTITPTLAEMLGDPLLLSRYRRYRERRRDLLHQEARSQGEATPRGRCARHYLSEDEAHRALHEERFGGELVSAFRAFQDLGLLEILACSATHAVLPLLGGDRARRTQVAVGVEAYRRAFGRAPRGFWLPECALDAGTDRFLAESGIAYAIVETHGVLFGDPPPARGTLTPVRSPAGVALLPRDIETGKQVWSAREGYPGDPSYREYYRDLGFDATDSEIRPYLHPDGVRRGVGVKYHRVTGDVGLGEKGWYEPEAAAERAAAHAGHFLWARQLQARHWGPRIGRPPLVTAPYDAELFGHWWYEGPRFLDVLVRRVCHDQDEVRLVTPSEALEEAGDLQTVEPCPSTWGDGGDWRVWLNGANSWMYRHLHTLEARLEERSRVGPPADPLAARALAQATREVLLAESSDWAFIVNAGTTVPYAVRRFREHADRARRLLEGLESGRLVEAEVAALERAWPLFPWLAAPSAAHVPQPAAAS